MANRLNHSRRAVWSWGFYDFANSAFATLIVTFIYGPYFATSIAPDKVTGASMWSSASSVSALIVALLSPIMGCVADRGGYRKRFVMIFTYVAVLCTAALFPLQSNHAMLALTLFVVANASMEMAAVFYNAFLPDVAPPDQVGRVSGLAWALGYGGGLLALLVALFGFVQTDHPLLGVSKEGGENIRATVLLVAGWITVFSLPFMFWVKEDKSNVTVGGGILKASYLQLLESAREIREYRYILRLLVARIFYNDGLVTIFALGAVYAATAFGFTMTETLILGVMANITAGAGAFAFGHLDDRIGGKKTILITIVGLSVASILAVFAPSKAWLWVAVGLVGIFVGPNQSASRSLMSRFVPPDKENEFFGFFAFSGKATAFSGPLLFSVFTEMFQSQRAGIASVLIFFVAGFLILLPLNEIEGIKASGRDEGAKPA